MVRQQAPLVPHSSSVCLHSIGQEPFKRRPILNHLHHIALRIGDTLLHFFYNHSPDLFQTNPHSFNHTWMKTGKRLHWSSPNWKPDDNECTKSKNQQSFRYFYFKIFGIPQISYEYWEAFDIFSDFVFLFYWIILSFLFLFLRPIRAIFGQCCTKQAGVSELCGGGRLWHIRWHRLRQKHCSH